MDLLGIPTLSSSLLWSCQLIIKIAEDLQGEKDRVFPRGIVVMCIAPLPFSSKLPLNLYQIALSTTESSLWIFCLNLGKLAAIELGGEVSTRMTFFSCNGF